MITVEEAEKRTILRVLVGSHVHGLDTPESDRDEDAIIIEPLSSAMGLNKPFEDLIREGLDTPNGPTDVKWISLRKWCSLALKGNPNALLALFAPRTHLLQRDALGGQLREQVAHFLSKQMIRSHLGYMQGQRNRMLNHQKEFYGKKAEDAFGHGGGHGKPRFDLIEKFGYDTKFGMHLIRLGMQGCELAESSHISLPMLENDRLFCMQIRRGEIKLEDVLKMSISLEERMKYAFDHSSLPDEPNYAAVEEFMLRVYIRMWSADRRLQDMIEDREIFGVDVRRH